jgi:hypothetical protein
VQRFRRPQWNRRLELLGQAIETVSDIGAPSAANRLARSALGANGGHVKEWSRWIERQRPNQVAALRDISARPALVVVTLSSGLTVAEATDLRKKVRAAGARFKVTKNRLARLALKDTRFSGLADRFKGPTAIAYSTDPVAAAKVVAAYAKGQQEAAPSSPDASMASCSIRPAWMPWRHCRPWTSCAAD